MDGLQAEIADRLAHGGRLVSVAEMDRLYREIGYRLDRSMDCRSPARIMTGPRAGESYPCCSTDAVDLDTGKSFAQFDGNRGAKYQAFKALRGTVFAISRGALLEV